MTKEQVEAALQAASIAYGEVTGVVDVTGWWKYRVEITDSVSYDQLAEIAKKLKTTNINFVFDEGFAGSEYTPGYGGEAVLTIEP